MSIPTRQTLEDMYAGFQSTPLLWKDKKVYGLEQFLPDETTNTFFKDKENNSIRLGKWVEKFVSLQIDNQKDASIILENIKVKKNNNTIGELDLLFDRNGQTIHLEIAYKFYLLNNSNDTKKLENWIGPNRKDNLNLKLEKIRTKQFPLLFKEETKTHLDQIDFESINQQTCFKAQLFIPLSSQNTSIEPLNNDCIVGTYFNYDKIDSFKECRFYIPSKLEWLCIPNENVKWLNYADAKPIIKLFIDRHRSPLCWLYSPKNKISKHFITWW